MIGHASNIALTPVAWQAMATDGARRFRFPRRNIQPLDVNESFAPVGVPFVTVCV
jgi:hypothetical protein